MLCDHPPVPITIAAPRSAHPFSGMIRPYAGVVALVDAKGQVTAAWLELSSGNNAYDRAAIAAMKTWTWVPAAAHCVAMDGESEFVVGGSDYTFAHPCDHDAVLTLAQQPKWPLLDTQANVPLHTDVAVSLDQFGEVLHTSVTRASGSRGGDAAVTQAALASNYFPAVHQCMPEPSQFVFSGGITP